MESLLVEAFLDDLRSDARPLSDAVEHWRAEARTCRGPAKAPVHAIDARQRIDLAALYGPVDAMPQTINGQSPRPVASNSAVTLDDRLSRSAPLVFRRTTITKPANNKPDETSSLRLISSVIVTYACVSDG